MCVCFPLVVDVHVSPDSVTERRGVASLHLGSGLCVHTWTMERRRMDAALLVLFLGHLATALEVPLDRKATAHTVVLE